MCVSPWACTFRSKAPWTQNAVSMWSKKGTPVLMLLFPEPSRLMVTVMSDSLVVRDTVAVRAAGVGPVSVVVSVMVLVSFR